MDPLSLTASIIAIATLAETVVTKLYSYCKAVKDCEEEVRKLMVEVNVLSAVLDRLARLAEDEEENEAESDGDEEMDEGEGHAQTGESNSSIPSIPGYIPACQSTLKEIELVLVSFERKGARVPLNRADGKTSKRSLFSRLSKSDLKWPLSKSKTIEIISNLERYKSTCILALAADELSAIREVLESTKLSSKTLADIKATSEKVLEFHESKETKEILHWFAPVNPALKHREFRREYQEGTGYWIFETPEYKEWLQTANSGLWIYGIPGAGKTILASLVIERLRSSIPKGFAYFYCRYNDPASQKPSSILGSLVAQLCYQDSGALEDATAFYATHNVSDNLSTLPSELELRDLLKQISRRFEHVYVVVDGLDEVGAAITVNRFELIRCLSTLHNSCSTIRTVIFSRAETDIKDQLMDQNFSPVSIAARSSDLQLYVAAKMNLLSIKDRKLKVEVLEALVSGADGMFFWTVCQIELLKTLPTAASIRKALKSLPPGLPATYTRIFERINSHYPVETQRFIQRTLTLLLDDLSGVPVTLDGLVQVISLEDDTESLQEDGIPEQESVMKWLGCLIRTTSSGVIELAHFSIKEFLRSSPEEVNPPTVHKYLVPDVEGHIHMLGRCYLYLSLSDFNQVPFTLYYREDRIALLERFPFYRYAALYTSNTLPPLYLERELPAFGRLFQYPTAPRCLYLWNQYCREEFLDHSKSYTNVKKGVESNLSDELTPLNIACKLGLVSVVARLLRDGADPNARIAKRLSPLHSAIIYRCWEFLFDNFIDPGLDGSNTFQSNEEDRRSAAIVSSLVAAKCDLNMTAKCLLGSDRHLGYLSPLYLALYTGKQNVSRLLVQNRALIICSEVDLQLLMRRVSEGSSAQWTRTVSKGSSPHWEPPWDDILNEILKSDYDEAFRKVLEDGRLIVREDPESDVIRTNDNLIKSVKANDKDAVEYYLWKGADPNALDFRGRSALSIAVENNNKYIFKELRMCGASLHSINEEEKSPLLKLFTEKEFSDLSSWLGNFGEPDFTDYEFGEIFKFARSRSVRVLRYILERAKSDDKMDILRSVAHSVDKLSNSEISDAKGSGSEASGSEAEASDAEVSDAEVSDAEVSDAEVSDAEVSGAEVSDSEVSDSEASDLEKSNPEVLDLLSACGLLSQEELKYLFFSMWTQHRMDRIQEFLQKYPKFDPLQCREVEIVDGGRLSTSAESGGSSPGPCCLCWAATKSSPQVLDTLLAQTDLFYTRDSIHGHLGRAIQRGHCGIADVLLRWGETPNLPPGYYSLIHRASYDLVAADDNNGDPTAMIKLLEKAGANLNSTCMGHNAIHFAVQNKAAECLQYLTSRGVDPHAVNVIGERPLHLACATGFETGVDFILQQPMAVDTINDPSDLKGTPLYSASFDGYAAIVAKLLRAGASIDLWVLPGNTFGPALYVACANGCVDVVRTLIAHGAKQNVQGPRYKSAADVARAFGRMDILDILDQEQIPTENPISFETPATTDDSVQINESLETID